MSEILRSASVSSGTDRLLADLVAEITDKLHEGEHINLEEYVARYPERAEELHRLVPALAIMDELHSVVGASGPAGAGCDAAALAADGKLGDFRLIREVGRGGMGVVYEAEQISLGRHIALKVLPFAGALDARQLQRFKNEAQAAAHLHHTNIVPVFSVGCERGVHYYAMQLIEGCTLASFIRQLGVNVGLQNENIEHGTEEKSIDILSGPMPISRHARAGLEPTKPELPIPRDDQPTLPVASLSTERSNKTPAFFRTIADLGIQAAEALEYAHQMGVVHRDIKPSNLLLDIRGNLWITDFGLAQFQKGSDLTLTGDLVGTLRYMSPEQALARRVVIDHRTDIYSLGVTLYELLTLQAAFSGKDRHELLRQIAFEEPRAPSRFNKTVPPELETIVLKAMEKNPIDRYATANELAADLRSWLRYLPIKARRPTTFQRMRKASRRHPGALAATGVAIVVGLLFGIAGLAVNNRMVRQEQLRTRDALDRAEQKEALALHEKAIAQADRDFLNKLLAQADPRVQADALRRSGAKDTGSKPNPTIHELLDRAARELAPNKIDEQFPGQALVQAEILKTIGEAYAGIGEYGSAIAHLERARVLQAREPGGDHLDTSATINSLATAYLGDGKYQDAARLFAQVRDLRIERLGRDHPETLLSMSNLIRTYYALGRHEEALAVRKEIVRLNEARLGPDHLETLKSMNGLANSYAALKRYDLALELHEKVLAQRKNKLGLDDTDTLQSMNNTANCLALLGRNTEALKLQVETLELRRSRLGDTHPDTLQSMNNVAKTYSCLGRHADALKLHEKTLALRKVQLKLGHPDTVFSMNAVGWLFANSPDRKLRNPGKALELAKQAVALAPENGDYRNTLGAAHFRMGDCESALRELAKSCEMRKGGDPTDWFFLAMAHWQLGDKLQARQWYDRAAQWMEMNHNEDEELNCFRAEASELMGIAKK